MKGSIRPFLDGPTVLLSQTKQWDCFLSGDDNRFAFLFYSRRLIFSVLFLQQTQISVEQGFCEPHQMNNRTLSVNASLPHETDRQTDRQTHTLRQTGLITLPAGSTHIMTRLYVAPASLTHETGDMLLI